MSARGHQEILSSGGANEAIYAVGGGGDAEPAGQVAGLRLSSETLSGLLKLAGAEHFFSLPQMLGEEPTPDGGSFVITIHTTSQTKTVVEQSPTRNARFDQLFAVLSAVVGLPD
jgi:hypothetical protein